MCWELGERGRRRDRGTEGHGDALVSDVDHVRGGKEERLPHAARPIGPVDPRGRRGHQRVAEGVPAPEAAVQPVEVSEDFVAGADELCIGGRG